MFTEKKKNSSEIKVYFDWGRIEIASQLMKIALKNCYEVYMDLLRSNFILNSFSHPYIPLKVTRAWVGNFFLPPFSTSLKGLLYFHFPRKAYQLKEKLYYLSQNANRQKNGYLRNEKAASRNKREKIATHISLRINQPVVEWMIKMKRNLFCVRSLWNV